jgi:hypothetical protein
MLISYLFLTWACGRWQVASASPLGQTSQTGFHLNDLPDQEVAILRELVKAL